MTDLASYTIRVTRVPLDAGARARLAAAGELPDDHRTRSVTEHDFVQVEAADDTEAVARARAQTKLIFKGETAEFHESMGDGTYRPLEA